MATIYEVTLNGTAQGQEIKNVLYYANLAAIENGWNPTIQAAMAVDVGTAFADNVVDDYCTEYSFLSASCRALDEYREVISTFTSEFAYLTDGGNINTTDTVAMVGIFSFTLLPIALSPTMRTPRRSYLAVGPIASSGVSPNGEWVGDTALKASMDTFLKQSFVQGSDTYAPVRLGVPNENGHPALGEVYEVAPRPFVSFRRSRLRGTKGG